MIKDPEPVFTGAQVADFDNEENAFIFYEEFLNKMHDGDFMKVAYTNTKGEPIAKEDYWLEGISPLGARYPDRFLIEIDGSQVLEGYFETPAYMSFLPPGYSVSTTDKGLKINMGIGNSSLKVTKEDDGVSIINVEDTALITPLDKIEAYFENK